MQRRKDIGLSQQELGDKIGVGQSIVSRMENGSSEMSVDLLSKVAPHLKLLVHNVIVQAEHMVKMFKRRRIQVLYLGENTNGVVVLDSTAVGTFVKMEFGEL